MSATIDFPMLVEYVGKRRKTSGGYGATPRLPATIEDTFEAIEISRYLLDSAPGVQLLLPPAGDTPLRNYLRRLLAGTWPGLRTTCQLLSACRFLGLPVEAERVRRYLAGQPGIGSELLATAYAAEIYRLLSPPGKVDQAWTAVPLPSRLTVADLHLYLLLRQSSGQLADPELDRFVPWLRHCQNGDGGFSFFPSTTSFIENSHHALAALSLLGKTPINPESARRFLISCQTGAGGFSRNPKAAPFLDATWHALAGLHYLGD